MIKLLWAMDENNLIGQNNHLPWHLKEELQHFKTTTVGQTILFGRLTYEGIGRPLPNRKTLVLTTKQDYVINHPDVKVVTNLRAIIDFYQNNPTDDIYICGGKKIYEATLPYADELIISYIKGKYEGDTYFPAFDLTQFILIKIVESEQFVIKYYKRKEQN
ncbi:dihydrofolate reductase [Spiroplasma sp. SV19]|uniref:dihydrofolate reductase n=1 Tax=Spiroplasma sp. SV19 TaxID=2570468 RepID=UPI0024B84748|nr:dihydrofolate reductase [Spiroplasma sp. SV19]WHQ36694.1 dihydrofolate reductase [Spiroplasma sp. SV19]